MQDTQKLGDIFTTILYSSVYQVKPFEKTDLSYTITDDFVLTLEQETKLRKDCAEKGIDLIVTRESSGATTLEFRNVKVEAKADGTGYVANVSFQVSPKNSASGSIATGTGFTMDGAKIQNVQIPSVTVPTNRKLVAYTVNGQLYKLVEVKDGEAVPVPETDLATWTAPDSPTAAYTTVDVTTATEYTIKWVLPTTGVKAGSSIQDTTAKFGVAITPPVEAAKAAAGDGYGFTGWTTAVPSTMPAYNMTVTASYHQHKWGETYTTGDCVSGISTHKICSVCGTDVVTETTDTHQHHYVTVFSDTGSGSVELERMVCDVCGHSEEQHITYKVCYGSKGQTVLNLNRYYNEEIQNGEVKDSQNNASVVGIRYYIGSSYANKNLTVYRLDDNGSVLSTYQPKLENGYLIFDANHFSTYMIDETGSNKQPANPVTQAELSDLANSSDASVTALSVTEAGIGTFSADTHSYTCSVGSSISSITIAVTTADKNAVVAIQTTDSDPAVNSVERNTETGVTTGTISLDNSSKTITILVTAPDGTATQTYTITVTPETETADYVVKYVSSTDTSTTVSLKNNTQSASSLVFVVAAYNKDGKMIAVNTTEKELSPAETVDLSVTYAANAGVKSVKAFVMQQGTFALMREAWSMQIAA